MFPFGYQVVMKLKLAGEFSSGWSQYPRNSARLGDLVPARMLRILLHLYSQGVVRPEATSGCW